MKNIFAKYVHLREESSPIISKIKLQKNDGSKEFTPFTVDKSTRPNLRHLIKAFEESPRIGVGYTTIDSSKGEVEPQLKKKSLYLTGGAVRDHLKNKTPKNYDLVTDATPSEIRMILTKSEDKFTETKPSNPKYSSESKYSKLPSAGSKNKIFYANRWDKQGKELEFIVQVNGEKFHLATLSKSSKSRKVIPNRAEVASSIEDDASNRDFTVNSLYIPLTTSDGDNSDLIDPFGGAHHLKTGEIKAVGDDFDARMKEDPSTAFRYIKLLNHFGNKDAPEDYKEILLKHKDMKDVPKVHVRGEFLKGLENPYTDPRKYIGSLMDTGLLHAIFPDGEFSNEKMPINLKNDRWLTTAWILKDNHPEKVKEILENGGWSKQEANDIAYLVKLYHWSTKHNFHPEHFYDIKSMPTGLTTAKIHEWMHMIKAHGPKFQAFMNHDDSDLSPYVQNQGFHVVNPSYVKILGRVPEESELDHIKKHLSTNRFIDSINDLM